MQKRSLFPNPSKWPDVAGQSLRILVIDDSETIVRQLDRVLKTLVPAAEVYAAPDISAGRLLFEKHRPGLVFLDMNLPGNPGKQFMSVHAKAAHESAVIVMTALPRDHPDVQTTFSHGAVAYLPKPLRRADVESLLRELDSGAVP